MTFAGDVADHFEAVRKANSRLQSAEFGFFGVVV